jgi:hypothetical protein
MATIPCSENRRSISTPLLPHPCPHHTCAGPHLAYVRDGLVDEAVDLIVGEVNGDNSFPFRF